MTKKRFLIVGSGGRESAFATRLSEDSVLFAVISHKNPTIIECVEQTGGAYLLGDTNDGEQILKFAQDHNIDYVFVSADEPLSKGVVDVLLDGGMKAVGGTKEACRIEWDKIYSIDMMNKVCPEYTPFYAVVENQVQLLEAIKSFEQKGLELVIKPQGLTGGKGVKVMPEHLKDYQDCIAYAKQLLNEKPNEKVLLVEKLKGVEFTIMGITDGQNLVMSPASYDYPFRYSGDTGPGTGGMGCFTNYEKKLHFMNDKDFQYCREIMQKIIDEIRNRGLFFNGVLNGGFFKTAKGIKFMEFNGRFGDPEGLNILNILASSFSKLIEQIWHGRLSEDKVKFIEKSSVVKYLVVKEYPEVAKEVSTFRINRKSIEQMGVGLYFASSVKGDNGDYQTLKKSRVLALSAVSKYIPDASDLINQAIEQHIDGDLEYRADIGSRESLEKIANQINFS